jgi:hypothetical protein
LALGASDREEIQELTSETQRTRRNWGDWDSYSLTWGGTDPPRRRVRESTLRGGGRESAEGRGVAELRYAGDNGIGVANNFGAHLFAETIGVRFPNSLGYHFGKLGAANIPKENLEWLT